MNENEIALQKARTKSLAAHFKKAASHHDAKAGAHEKMVAAHKAHSDYHSEAAGTTDDAHDKAFHKASAAFHKAKGLHHERVQKAHSSAAEHNRNMADAHETDDHKKIYKLLGIEEETTLPIEPRPVTEPVNKAETAPAPATTAPATTAPATTAPAGTNADFNENIAKALDVKLTEAVNAAFERVLNSDDFSKRVDSEIAKKLLEKLGSSTVPSEIKTFPVPRTSGKSNGSAPADPAIDMTGVDAELADLVKTEF